MYENHHANCLDRKTVVSSDPLSSPLYSLRLSVSGYRERTCGRQGAPLSGIATHKEQPVAQGTNPGAMNISNRIQPRRISECCASFFPFLFLFFFFLSLSTCSCLVFVKTKHYVVLHTGLIVNAHRMA